MRYDILTPSETNNYYFELFKAGDEAGLKYIYDKMKRPLQYYGRKLCNDDFLIGSIIQDGLLRVWQLREQVQSLFHLFYFIRLVMRRQRARHYASLDSKQHSRIYFVENSEDYAYSNFINSMWENSAEKEYAAITAERALQIDDAINHLPDMIVR